jgi:hypothetical protein
MAFSKKWIRPGCSASLRTLVSQRSALLAAQLSGSISWDSSRFFLARFASLD